MSKFLKNYHAWSEINDPKSSARSCPIQEEKNGSSQDWGMVIMHVVTNKRVNSYRKKLTFSHNGETLEDKICVASCIFKR